MMASLSSILKLAGTTDEATVNTENPWTVVRTAAPDAPAGPAISPGLLRTSRTGRAPPTNMTDFCGVPSYASPKKIGGPSESAPPLLNHSRWASFIPSAITPPASPPLPLPPPLALSPTQKLGDGYGKNIRASRQVTGAGRRCMPQVNRDRVTGMLKATMVPQPFVPKLPPVAFGSILSGGLPTMGILPSEVARRKKEAAQKEKEHNATIADLQTRLANATDETQALTNQLANVTADRWAANKRADRVAEAKDELQSKYDNACAKSATHRRDWRREKKKRIRRDTEIMDIHDHIQRQQASWVRLMGFFDKAQARSCFTLQEAAQIVSAANRVGTLWHEEEEEEEDEF
jgi:hypothetical protein